jgi:hypothetical protein
VAELFTSRQVRRKLIKDHQVELADLEDAVVCVPGLRGVWDDDPDRGPRVILRVPIRGIPHIVVLYPIVHPLGGMWNLGSAYRDR